MRLGLAARVVRWSRRSQMHQGRCLEMGAAELRCAREGAPPAGWHLHHLTLGVEVGVEDGPGREGAPGVARRDGGDGVGRREGPRAAERGHGRGVAAEDRAAEGGADERGDVRRRVAGLEGAVGKKNDSSKPKRTRPKGSKVGTPARTAAAKEVIAAAVSSPVCANFVPLSSEKPISAGVLRGPCGLTSK